MPTKEDLVKPLEYLYSIRGIMHYIRNSSAEKIGVFVAMKDGESLKVGYSVVNVRDGDQFDRDFGVRKAIYRARPISHLKAQIEANRLSRKSLPRAPENILKADFGIKEIIPDIAADNAEDFLNRCRSYFKDAKIE